MILVIVLFFLAISDLVVGVSNDAVNFLNSAVGAKVGTFKIILGVAALGIVVGCTFSGGMMEVARKGIFHPEHFYFSEIMLLFLAVMVTDVILLDAFNTFGMPTSTTVSIVFELLGAAVAISLIKIYTDPNALAMAEYINSSKALAIISGILLSVIIAFTVGVAIQYLTRLLFSFDYEKKLKYFGAVWGGLALTAITYFMLVKGSKGATFMTENVQAMINDNGLQIILICFVVWTVIFQLVILFTKFDILKFIVLVGTFALAMAFAGNDLVNFIGVPLAGYNSYEIFMQNGGAGPEGLLMNGLAGQVPTPTLLLLMAGIIMTITLWTSKKARSVVKTSLDLGRQYEGSERFDSYAVSRSLVRSFGKMAGFVSKTLPDGLRKKMEYQFDEKPFSDKQAKLGKEAPAFDMIRAAVTLVVSSILIAMGTNLKLPLSTTYVTFMVFMGTSLADGAWGRESAVYRVSGVISVIGGWFFTALSAFTVAFIFANIFYFGGTIAIIAVLVLTGAIIYRTHKYHGQKLEEEVLFEKAMEDKVLTREEVIELSEQHLSKMVVSFNKILSRTLDALASEDLTKLIKTNKELKSIKKQISTLKRQANGALDQIADDEIESIHFYILVVDYLHEMSSHIANIVKPSLDHVDNNHKPLLPIQIQELKNIYGLLKEQLDATVSLFQDLDAEEAKRLQSEVQPFVKAVRNARKNQIKRIKKNEIGTRNSVLFLNLLGEFRNLALFTNRIVKVLDDLIINPSPAEETVAGKV